MTRGGYKMRQSKGFTLIEIAITLVIIGLLIGLGASLIGPLTKRAKITETKDTLNAAVESVIGFAAKNNKLPTHAEFPQVVRNPNDAWTKPLVYFVDSSLTTLPNNPAEGICGRGTNLIVCTDANCNNQIHDVAFIVVSGGPNYNVQTGPSTPYPAGNTHYYKVYPQDTPNVDDYPPQDTPDPNDFTRQEEYDDIVKWVTLNELRIKVGCQGAQLKILNNELPYGYVGSTYNATIYAEGGVPFQSGRYGWCIQGLPSWLSSDPPDISYSNCSSLPEASWVQADKLEIYGTPTAPGSYKLTFFVRDNQDPSGPNDNIAQKTFVLTIHPQQSSGPIGAQVSFANDINQFQQAEGDSNAVQVNGNTLVLGGGVYGSNGYGCFWYPSSYQLNGKTMRAYFKFKFTSIDNSIDSTSYADGFTFAVVSENMPNNACGGAGINIGFGGLNYDSVAVEFDTYPNGGSWGWNDPANYNHVAIVKRGNNKHGVSTAMGNNPPCPSSPPGSSEGCAAPGPITWLEDGVEHTVRVEIHTGCDTACSNCGSNPQNYALIKAWINCSSCNDLTQDYSSTPTISHCFQLPSSMNNVKFGFTEGTWGRTQNVEIKDFGIGFY